jgi:inorganic triphosphatase YgiF
MEEIELKFQVPPAAQAAVRRALATATAQTTRLQAQYFDTPGRHLAAAGLALRLRQEDRVWVQTLKGRGDGLMHRLEHEVVRPPQRGVPLLDIRLHAGTPAGQALSAALAPAMAAADAADAPELAMLYATDIRRLHRLTRSGGAVVEIAFDVGHIRAGTQKHAVCELEFELKKGPPQALLALALRWVERFGLWLDIRSKAEIGNRLAQTVAESQREGTAPAPFQAPEVRAERLVLGATRKSAGALPADTALRAMVRNALAQILGNACEIADGRYRPEHVHQLRVGLRRLRTALREFGAGSARIDPAWDMALSDLFGRLGAARDRDALGAGLWPALAQAGAPLVVLPPPTEADDPAVLLRGASFTRTVLMLIGYVQAPAASEPVPATLDALARQRLQLLWRRATDPARRYAALEEDDQHRIRKRLKRLRYTAEFVASLYDAKAVEAFLVALRPAQDALGDHHDLMVARDAYQAQLADDPQAWFALGWIAAQRDAAMARCVDQLRRLARARRFWR